MQADVSIAAFSSDAVLYQPDMMDAEVRRVFEKEIGASHPGLVCGRFRPSGGIDCAVLMAHREYLEDGAWMLGYLMNADSSAPLFFPLEEYGCIKFGAEAFMRFLPRSELVPFGESAPVQMPGDGFEVVFSGHTSHGYFWDNGVLRKVYTSD
ncbi:MAG: hypothetical protein AB1916_05325 [Thermodesulfobacteriota bacterium]